MLPFLDPALDEDNNASMPLLLDGGIKFSALPEEPEKFTTTAILEEHPDCQYLLDLEEQGKTMATHTRSDLKENGGTVSVTGAGVYADDTTDVHYDTSADESSCPNGNTTTVTLIGDQGSVPACSHLTENSTKADFGLLVIVVAFPIKLVTQDKCLGWCARNLYACLQVTGSWDLLPWNYMFNDRNNV